MRTSIWCLVASFPHRTNAKLPRRKLYRLLPRITTFLKSIKSMNASAPSSQFPSTRSTTVSSSVVTSSDRSSTQNPHQFDKATNDHTVSHRPRFAQKDYPPDCPPLNVRWYYAIDQPKKRAFPTLDQKTKPLKPPNKYVPFGDRDSRELETAYQNLLETEDIAPDPFRGSNSESTVSVEEKTGSKGAQARKSNEVEEGEVAVPVNEDYLFDVKIKARELVPVYWLGPTYDVRRGTWFFQEGSTLRPCEENLATQIEEGYLKVKPFRQQSVSGIDASTIPNVIIHPTAPEGASATLATSTKPTKVTQPAQNNTWRLFGSYMNSFVVYQDVNTAWLLTDDFYGKLSSTLYQRVTAGSHMGGSRLVRGYSEPNKAAKDDKFAKSGTPLSSSHSRPVTPTPETKNLKGEADTTYKRKSMPPLSTPEETNLMPTKSEARRALERQLSSLEGQSEEEEVLEQDIHSDYKTSDDPGEEQERPIDHILLVTHGIGQRLSMRMESVNFVHDINILRKSLKGVYDASPDLQALNIELGASKKNCRIQCLPVCWRHLIDFPKQSLRQNRPSGEHDLGVGSQYEAMENEYPSLADITLEGVPAVRSLMTDLALDILLYHSQVYRELIVRTVLAECNRIYALFKARNRSFNGKVSLVGHSLGSAILFDLLCQQPDDLQSSLMVGIESLVFDFPVHSLFCIGSPVGLFEMLKGRTISARTNQSEDSSSELESLRDSFLTSSSENPKRFRKQLCVNHQQFNTSSPKCEQLYNIFHPTDPIAYRIEPLVSKAMAELKPQPLPYTKRGLLGTQLAGGISGIGQSVTRGVSNMWSSLSSGIASSLLNRSLGLNDTNSASDGKSVRGEHGGASATTPSRAGEKTLDTTDPNYRHISPPNNINDEIETLYEGFQKRRCSEVLEREKNENKEGNPLKKLDKETMQKELEKDEEAEEKGRQLKFEEEKVRALNPTGRIDFAIQEGVFDISLIASIASHLNYWNDEDLSHFIIAQLLAKQNKKNQERYYWHPGL